MPPSPDELTSARATRYATIRRRLMLVELAGWMAFLWACQMSGRSSAVAAWTVGVTSNDWLRLPLYLAVFGACSYILFLPLHVYSSFLLEHRFGLSRLSVRGWIVREIKQVGLSGAFSLLIFEVLYALLRRCPITWPAFATIGWIGVSVVIARIFPTVLLPIFYKSAPLADDALAQRLMELCRRAKLSVLGIFRVGLGVETRKANAALAGFGGTRRVLLSDTLLERFSADEIETVLDHELGHQVHHHIGKLLILSAAGSWLLFSLIHWSSGWWVPRLGLQGLADIAGFPMLMLALSVIGVISLPLQNGISRYFEWQADRFAVTVSGRAGAFASALRKLGELNLADPNPPRWVEWMFYDHPPIGKRVRAAESAALARPPATMR